MIEVAAQILQSRSADPSGSARAEGIAAAKENGKHMGRPATCYPPNWNEIYQQWKAGELTAVAAMKKLGLKRSTFYKLANTYGEEDQ